MYDYYRSSPPRARRPKPVALVSSKWRVVSARPLPVSTEVDAQRGEFITDLEVNSLCHVLHEDPRPGAAGETRVCIVDPVWKGWITLRTARGDSNLEHIDGDIGDHLRIGAAPPPTLPATPLFQTVL